MSPTAYALRVEGHSMVDQNIQHGDLEPGHIHLQPANPAMKPIVLHNHEIRILGVVGAVIREYRHH